MATFLSELGFVWENVEYATAQTDTILVAAPGAGKALQVLEWKFSTNTRMKIILEQGANLVDVQHADSYGGQIASFSKMIQLPENTALTATTSVDGDVFIGVFHRTVAA